MIVIPHSELRHFLRCLQPTAWAVMKNSDLWASLQRGGDWDLVVADRCTAEGLLRTHLGAPSRAERRSYVSSLHYSWGHIDFLPGLRWRGVELLSAASIIDAASMEETGFPVSRLAHQAIAAWIYPLLAYGGLNVQRYGALVHEARSDDGDELRKVLTMLFGNHLSQMLVPNHGIIDVASHVWFAPAMRKELVRRAVLREPRKLAARSLEFLAREMVVRCSGSMLRR